MLVFHEKLSPRQQEVFYLVIRGYGNQEIAAKLFLSKYTVKQHVFAIMQKCGMKDRMTMTLLHYDLPNWMEDENGK